tara:strand:- start:3771 stop:4382 length:612 start_codon:yes stop_codon:yes gene_type:complete
MIVIVDYGCGNVNAFVNVFNRMNIESIISSGIDEINQAKKIILPGVGSFDNVMKSFNGSGLRDIVEKKVFKDKIDVLGVCSGMQILAESSEEGNEKGLGWIDGKVKIFDTNTINHQTKLPHMGWNTVNPIDSSLFSGIDPGSKFYFVHSFYFHNSFDENRIAETFYGINFSSAINRSNIYGVQFHPEKSHQNGEQLLYNFSQL